MVVRATADSAGNGLPLEGVRPCMDATAVTAVQAAAARQRVDEQVIDYAVRIVRATRDSNSLSWGAGSRGGIGARARAAALLAGRAYVTPDDVRRVALPALRHRVALAPDALIEGRTANALLAEILNTVPAPRA